MIRAQLNSTATGSGSPIAVLAPATFQEPADSRINMAFQTAGGQKRTEYLLMDADGVSWEYGMGRQIGSNWYRDYIIESTAADLAITLSAGTHTIYELGGGIATRFASVRWRSSWNVASGITNLAAQPSSATIHEQVDSAYDMPGVSAISSPANVYALPGGSYYKGVMFNVMLQSSVAVGGSGWLHLYNQHYSYSFDPMISFVVPTDITSRHSADSPMLGYIPPIGTSPAYGGSVSTNEWEFVVNHTGAGTVAFDLYITVDLYL